MTNKELIEKWYYKMWNDWDMDIIPEILDEKITFRGSLGQEKRGREGLKEYIEYIRDSFPDFRNEIELIIDEKNKSFAKLRYNGTHKGKIFGVEPTNKKIAYSGTAVFTFEKGKIMDVWVLGDVYGLLQQLR
jgi:steroid delta-isomerase-like uncharacterized protein